MTISKRMKQVFWVALVLGSIIGAWTIWYVFYKPHRNPGEEQAAYAMTSEELSRQISKDAGALTTYIDKAISITGEVTEKDGKTLALDNIRCTLLDEETEALKKVQIGDMVKIQGRLTTYNDLMEEITMDQCVLK